MATTSPKPSTTAKSKGAKNSSETKDYTPKNFAMLHYSEKCIVFHGLNTKRIKNELKSFGAKFSMYLTCGPGWIFQKEKFLSDLAESGLTLNQLLEKLDGLIQTDMELNPTLENQYTKGGKSDAAKKAMAAFKNI
jgi:hypothetical protein